MIYGLEERIAFSTWAEYICSRIAVLLDFLYFWTKFAIYSIFLWWIRLSFECNFLLFKDICVSEKNYSPGDIFLDYISYVKQRTDIPMKAFLVFDFFVINLSFRVDQMVWVMLWWIRKQVWLCSIGLCFFTFYDSWGLFNVIQIRGL